MKLKKIFKFSLIALEWCDYNGFDLRILYFDFHNDDKTYSLFRFLWIDKEVNFDLLFGLIRYKNFNE